MSTKQSPIQKLGITAKTLRQAGLALVCSGFIALGAQASYHSPDHLQDAVVFDGADGVQAQTVGFRGYKRSLSYGSLGFSRRGFSGYGYSKYGYSKYGYSGKKYRSKKYYYGNSFRSGRSLKGSRGFSRGSRFGSRRGFRSSRY